MSASSASVSVTMRPCRIKSLITSTARSDMRLGELLDGDRLGQHDLARDFLFLSCAPWPLSRWVRRRNAATERVRSSSPEVALVTVRRPRLRCSPPRGGRGVGTMTFCPGRTSAGRRMTRLRFVLLAAGRARERSGQRRAPGAAGATRGIDGDGAGSPPARRRRASSSDWRLKLASWARRSSSSRLRASAASRSRRSRASRSRRASASASWRRRSSSSCARASISARARASRCSAVRVGSTTPVLGGGRRGGFAGATGAGLAAAARMGFAAGGGLGRSRGQRRTRRLARRRLARRQNAALHLLDDDRLAAPVRKALSHRALLDRALQMQRRLRRRGAQRLVAIVRFTHAYS